MTIKDKLTYISEKLEKYRKSVISNSSAKMESYYYMKAEELKWIKKSILELSLYEAIVEYDYFSKYIIDLHTLVGKFNRTRAALITSIESDRKSHKVCFESFANMKDSIPKKIHYFQKPNRYDFIRYIRGNRLFLIYDNFLEIKDFILGCISSQTDFDFIQNFPNRIHGFLLVNGEEIMKIWLYFSINYLCAKSQSDLIIVNSYKGTPIVAHYIRILISLIDVISDESNIDIIDKYILQNKRIMRLFKFLLENCSLTSYSLNREVFQIEDRDLVIKLSVDNLNKLLIQMRSLLKKTKRKKRKLILFLFYSSIQVSEIVPNISISSGSHDSHTS